MAWVAYDNFLKKLFTLADGIDFDDSGTTVKVALLKNTYTPDRAAHDFFNDVSSYEVTGTGYTAGGNALSNKTVTVASNVVTIDADDPTAWAASSGGFTDCRYAVVYKDTGTASTSPLIAYHNFTTDKTNVGGSFAVQLAADGIVTQGQS